MASVALLEGDRCLQMLESDSQKSHAEVLHVFTERILKKEKTNLHDIDLFVTGCGPGSFTGIRVSLNIAKSFSFAFQKPLVAIDSLTILAELNKSLAENLNKTKGQNLKILSLINAYKNMSYYSLFETSAANSPKVLKGPSVIPMKDIETLLKEPVFAVGDGYLTYQKFLPESLLQKMHRLPQIIDYPRADVLGTLAYDKARLGLTLDWKSVQPLYIRSSEAEENKRGIIWSPIDFKE